MRVMLGGYLEARGGFDRLKPSGGTAADVASAGYVVGAHEHSMPNLGWAVLATTGGTVYSTNRALFAWFFLWPTAVAQNDAIYLGSDARFSRSVFYIAQGANGATPPTYAYEYWNGSAWSALTTTSTPSFTTTGEQVFEWAVPSNWAATDVNSVLQYWVRIRVTNSPSSFATRPAHSTQRLYADWIGDRQIYVAVSDGASATNNGAVKRCGQSGTTENYTSVSTSLFSGNDPPYRFASYRGVLYVVNGKEQKRWNQDTVADMGFTKPTTSGIGLANSGTGLTGVFIYALTYGYGPAGEWGESNEIQSAATAALANNGQAVTFNLTNLPAAGIVDYVYVYRTADLASMTSDARTAAPMYRIATVVRNADGTMPTSYTDNTAFFPFPPRALNIAVNTPPVRCRHIAVHKNRCFLGSNNQYPGRVWWSEPFQAESFITDENFADFTRQTGSAITGMVEFNDQIVVFTEDQMFGIANVDTDQPDVYVIHPSVGCVAPDAVASGAGFLIWPGRQGVYAWDGQALPERVSNEAHATFGRMSLENHGRSRAIVHDRRYSIALINQANSVAGVLEYDLVTKAWMVHSNAGAQGARIAPFAVALAPLGHADAGVRHPLWSIAGSGATAWPLYLGEYTTADDGTGFGLQARVHFGPTGYRTFSPKRMAAYYETGGGGLSGTPALSAVGPAYQWATPTLGAVAADTGTEYNLVEAYSSNRDQGSGGILAQWLATTQAGGTLNGQRLLAAYLDGEFLEPPEI